MKTYHVLTDFSTEERREYDTHLVTWQGFVREQRDSVLANLIEGYLTDATAFEESDVPDAPPEIPVSFASFAEADAYHQALKDWKAGLEWQDKLTFRRALLAVCIPWKCGCSSPWFRAGEWAISRITRFEVVIKPWDEVVAFEEKYSD